MYGNQYLTEIKHKYTQTRERVHRKRKHCVSVLCAMRTNHIYNHQTKVHQSPANTRKCRNDFERKKHCAHVHALNVERFDTNKICNNSDLCAIFHVFTIEYMCVKNK